MKKSILSLLVIILFLFTSGTIYAQTKSTDEAANTEVKQSEPDKEVFKAEVKADEKESILNILNASKITILRSSNSNTTEQNLQLIRGIEDVMKLINERFQKVSETDKEKPKKQ